MDINVGDLFTKDGKTIKCINKHASGKWFTYHFSDGWSFTGAPDGMIDNRTLIPSLPPPTPPKSYLPLRHGQSDAKR